MLIQFILIVGFGLALYVTWKRWIQRVIPLLEAVGWTALWGGGIAVTLIPKITERLAAVFGVGRGVDLVLYAAVAVLFFMVFKLFVINERLERKLTDLVRREALGEIFKPDTAKTASGRDDNEMDSPEKN